MKTITTKSVKPTTKTLYCCDKCDFKSKSKALCQNHIYNTHIKKPYVNGCLCYYLETKEQADIVKEINDYNFISWEGCGYYTVLWEQHDYGDFLSEIVSIDKYLLHISKTISKLTLLKAELKKEFNK